MATVDTNIEKELGRVGRDLVRKWDHVLPQIERAFERDGVRWTAEMQSRVRGPLVRGGRKAPTASLAVRSGELADSFFHKVRRENDGPELRKGNYARHAAIHELGTKGAGGELDDIVPRNGRYLTIPLEDALGPSGLPKDGKRSIRDWDGFFLETNGKLFFVTKDGAGGLSFLFYLKESVSIPPRLGMKHVHEAQAEARTKDISDAISRGMAS